MERQKSLHFHSGGFFYEIRAADSRKHPSDWKNFLKFQKFFKKIRKIPHTPADIS